MSKKRDKKKNKKRTSKKKCRESALNIFGKMVKVCYLKPHELEFHTAAGALSSGKDKTIKLHPVQSPDNMAETFIHEIIHQLDYELQLGLKEKQTHRLAVGLYAVFACNANTFDFKVMFP